MKPIKEIYRGYGIQQDGNTFTIMKDGKVVSGRWHTLEGAQGKVDQLKRHEHATNRR